MSEVHVVVPTAIDDPARPSGGNTYDRHVCDGLVARGWHVHEHAVEASWPRIGLVPIELGETLSTVPDGSVTVIDGLIASASAATLVPVAERLRLVVLVHMPQAVPGEGAVLRAAHSVITTSRWTRGQLLDVYDLDATTVHVIEPGVETAEATIGTDAGENVLCVAPVSPHKGQDTLVSALAAIRDLTWRCRLVGSLERDPDFAACLRRQILEWGLDGRVELCGVRTGSALVRTYATSDLLVHASRGETYGMVVTEALARALPVVATAVGGVPEALGDTPAGKPGVLVSPDRPSDLAVALRSWLTDDKMRDRLRCAAARRRQALTSWDTTVGRMAQLLEAVADR